MDNIIKAIAHLNEEVSDIKKDVELLKKKPGIHLNDEWLDGQEVMQALHISRRTLQTIRDSGKLIPSRVLKKYYYKVSDIKSLLEENYVRYHYPKKP